MKILIHQTMSKGFQTSKVVSVEVQINAYNVRFQKSVL